LIEDHVSTHGVKPVCKEALTKLSQIDWATATPSSAAPNPDAGIVTDLNQVSSMWPSFSTITPVPGASANHCEATRLVESRDTAEKMLKLNQFFRAHPTITPVPPTFTGVSVECRAAGKQCYLKAGFKEGFTPTTCNLATIINPFKEFENTVTSNSADELQPNLAKITKSVQGLHTSFQSGGASLEDGKDGKSCVASARIPDPVIQELRTPFFQHTVLKNVVQRSSSGISSLNFWCEGDSSLGGGGGGAGDGKGEGEGEGAGAGGCCKKKHGKGDGDGDGEGEGAGGCCKKKHSEDGKHSKDEKSEDEK